MAKVLLINPNKWGRGITAIWIASHSAALKAAGHQVELFDSTFYSNWTENENKYNTLNKQYLPTDYDTLITWNENNIVEDLQNKINELQPDIIMWSAISSHIHGEGEYVNVQYGYELVSKIDTDAILITGGLQVTAIPEKVIEMFPKTDFFIRGESELVLTEVANNIDNKDKIKTINGVFFKENGKLVLTGKQEILKDMDQIPLYDYGIFNEMVLFRPYNGKVLKAVDYEFSRGCIFTCSYCVETVIQKYYGVTEASEKSGSLLKPQNYLRSKSAQRIFDELTYLNKELGVELVRCQDTNFLTINRKVLLELAKLMEESDLTVKLYVESRLDRVNIGEINLLKRLKVDGVGTGLEVASDQFRAGHLNRFADTEKLVRNANLLRDAGIKFTTYNIIGLPSETEDMILDTIKFNQELEPNNITIAFYSPYLGTIEANKGVELDDFNEYEHNVDGQLRTVAHSKLIKPELLDFYKKYFNHFVRNGLEELNQLKEKEGLL